MAKVILLALLMVLSSNATAQDKMEDDMVCREAIAHAFRFVLQPDAKTVHTGAWYLIRRTDLDNTQTYVALTVFHAMQQVSWNCLLYTSPSPRDRQKSRMPSSA